MSDAIRPALRLAWREHGAALLSYALLALALAWPLPQLLTSQIVGEGGDPIHNLWLIWHTREALLGRQPWFAAPLLYYPQGITRLTHGLGPVMGVLALPFWPLGTLAAHNGALLVALWLSGYAMYLLGRGLGFGHGVALFGGAALMSAPMCLGGLRSHMTKVLLAGPPLALLCLHRALSFDKAAAGRASLASWARSAIAIWSGIRRSTPAATPTPSC